MKDLEKWTGEKLPVDTNQHGLKVCQEAYKMVYEKRREANAAFRAVKAEVGAYNLPADFDPEAYRNVSLKDKYGELQAAQEANKAIKDAQDELIIIGKEKETNELKAEQIREHNRNNAKSRENEINTKITALENQITLLRKEKEQVKEKLADNLARIDGEEAHANLVLLNHKKAAESLLAETKPVDIAPLEKSIQEFEEKKALVGVYDNREGAKKRLETAEAEAKRLDDIVKTLATKPAELIAGADLPIEGLGIDDSGNVTIDNRPIKSLSTSEQIRLALDIARATSKDLKIICVDGLEALDKSNQAEFLRQAAADDYQYFVTIVSDDDSLKIKNSLEEVS
jgi:predicted  nucleic acid-binding Zn-ribbon protein